MLPAKVWERNGVADAEDALRKGTIVFYVLRLKDGSSLFMDPRWKLGAISLDSRTIHHILQESAGITDTVMSQHGELVRNYFYSYNSRMLAGLMMRAVSDS